MNLVVGGSNGVPHANSYVLVSTNVTSPLAAWKPVMTNTFDASGNFIFTNAMDPGSPQQFYRLQLP